MRTCKSLPLDWYKLLIERKSKSKIGKWNENFEPFFLYKYIPSQYDDAVHFFDNTKKSTYNQTYVSHIINFLGFSTSFSVPMEFYTQEPTTNLVTNAAISFGISLKRKLVFFFCVHIIW